MTSQLILGNARIVTPSAVISGALAIDDGLITDIDTRSSAAVVDLDGDYLIPGLVELHTDNLERHFAPRPGVLWPAMQALAGHDAQLAAAGITTVLDSIVVGGHRGTGLRDRIVQQSIDVIRAGREANILRADHYLHLRLELPKPNVVESFEAYADEPLVKLASVMDHTPGQRQWHDREQHIVFLRGRNNWTADEAERHFAGKQAEQALHAAPNRAALLAMCRARDLMLASHDDTTVEHTDETADDGIAISEFPTTRAAAERARERGLGIILGSPNVVRGGSHSGNVSALDLAGDGLVDALASDYVPASLLHAALIFHHRLGQSLPDAIATVTRNPAAMVGFSDRGAIEIGKRADLVQVREQDGVPVIRAVWRAGLRVA